MATVWYQTWGQAPLVANAHNDLKKQIGAGAFFHLDAYENPVASANATNLATAVTLVNEIRAVYEFHRGDTLALKAADGVAIAQAAANPNAGDGGLAQAILLANDIKAKYNVHIASAVFHYNADAANAVATANATVLADLLTLLNAIKAAFNLHMASAPTSKSIRVLPA